MSDINQKLMDLWEETPIEYTCGRMPYFQDEREKGQVIFMGLNPSFSIGGYKSCLEDTVFRDIDLSEFYSFPASDNFNIETALEIERKTKENYVYFTPFKDIMSGIDIGWQSMDFFYLRETSQKILRDKIFQTAENLNGFGLSQMKITKDLLEQVEPKMIVVVNALGSRLFKKSFQAEFDDTHGCYFTQLGDKSVPTFLTSMLSGQRALDTFSKERLRWHIRKMLREFIDE